MLSGEATDTNLIVFDLTRSGLEPTIYCTRGKHANQYTTNAVQWTIKKFLLLVTATILNGGWGCQTQFESDPPKDHPCQVWFSGFRGVDLNVKVYG